MYRFSTGDETSSVHVTVPGGLSDGQWHKVEVNYYNRYSTLYSTMYRALYSAVHIILYSSRAYKLHFILLNIRLWYCIWLTFERNYYLLCFLFSSLDCMVHFLRRLLSWYITHKVQDFVYILSYIFFYLVQMRNMTMGSILLNNLYLRVYI